MDWTAWGGLPPMASEVASAKYKWSLHLSEDDSLNVSKRESGPPRRPLPRDKSPRLVPDNMKFQTSKDIPFLQSSAIVQAFPCNPGDSRDEYGNFDLQDDPGRTFASTDVYSALGSAPPHHSSTTTMLGSNPPQLHPAHSGLTVSSMDMSSMFAANTTSQTEGANLEWLQAEMADLIEAMQEIKEAETNGVKLDPRFLERYRKRVDGLLKQVDIKESQYTKSSGILERRASNDKQEAVIGQMRTVELVYEEDDVFNRRQYIGQIRDGLRHGLGVMRWADGAKYEGEWQDDKPCGFAVEFYADDSGYAGQFLHDERHGLGCFRLPTGEVWSGHWESGERHGPGFWERNSVRTFSYFERGRKSEAKIDRVSTDAMSSLLADTLRAATNAAGLARMLAANFASEKVGVSNDSIRGRRLDFDSESSLLSPVEHVSSPTDHVQEPDLVPPARGPAGTPGGQTWLELQWEQLQALGREARRIDQLFAMSGNPNVELEGNGTLPSKVPPALYPDAIAAAQREEGVENGDAPTAPPIMTEGRPEQPAASDLRPSEDSKDVEATGTGAETTRVTSAADGTSEYSVNNPQQPGSPEDAEDPPQPAESGGAEPGAQKTEDVDAPDQAELTDAEPDTLQPALGRRHAAAPPPTLANGATVGEGSGLGCTDDGERRRRSLLIIDDLGEMDQGAQPPTPEQHRDGAQHDGSGLRASVTGPEDGSSGAQHRDHGDSESGTQADNNKAPQAPEAKPSSLAAVSILGQLGLNASAGSPVMISDSEGSQLKEMVPWNRPRIPLEER